MLGEYVAHVRFGEGRVTAYAPPRIEVTFEGPLPIPRPWSAS